jgi:hypothetical protein
MIAKYVPNLNLGFGWRGTDAVSDYIPHHGNGCFLLYH